MYKEEPTRFADKLLCSMEIERGDLPFLCWGRLEEKFIEFGYGHMKFEMPMRLPRGGRQADCQQTGSWIHEIGETCGL